MKESDWARLIDQLRTGDCTPFIGAGASGGNVPSGGELSREWAARFDYPFADDGDLARVMQYARSILGDAGLKHEFSRHLSTIGPPDFTTPGEIHSSIAAFPIPVFLTTNYDDFLFRALRASGKEPSAAICPWHEGVPYDRNLFERGPGIRPDVNRPLVYHLYGSTSLSSSMVLTEEDYIDFLVHMTTARAQHNRHVIPPIILDALANRPLLFLGYTLQEWTFRVLFHGLIRRYPAIRRRRHVSVQLTPGNENVKPGAALRAKEYLDRYFDGWEVSIFWGTPRQFCAELDERMGNRS
ncbi:SIR2 family NAD-dependent protein deacylase [Nonomuraea sp. NPDC050022]|uniref:SIR2 family NAD-dependent protein deacylase n=1 Tax=unclassified Nonomuraea TaxID=2593643 RepID=UPI0033EEF6E2